MKNKLQKIGADIIPLSSRRGFLLYLLIVCTFEFLFFFTPALASASIEAEKSQNSEDEPISLSTPFKSSEPDPSTEIVMINHLVSSPDINPVSTVEEKTLRLNNPQVVSRSEEINNEDYRPQYRVVRVSEHVITAYNSEVAQTDSTPCITANGFNVCEHGIEDTIGANFLKLGTKVRIPELFGDQIFIVRDRMNKRFPNRVDVWMIKKQDALQFGVKTAKIEVLEEI